MTVLVNPFMVGGAAVAAWTQTFAQALTSEWAWSTYTLRLVVQPADLSVSGTQTRVTLKAGSSLDIVGAEAYIGHAAPASGTDFLATPVPIKIAGSASINIAVGVSVVSDALPFALDKTQAVVIAAYIPQGNLAYDAAGISSAVASWYTSGNDAGTVPGSGYSLQGDSIANLVVKIEVLA